MPKQFVVEASQNYLPAIKSFLNQNPLEHIHLDWGSVEQWVNKKNYLVYLEDEEIIGILSCPPPEKNDTWIRHFAIKKFCKPSAIWNILFTHAITNLSTTSKSIEIFSLAIWDWYERNLLASGFHPFQEIVTLEWNNTLENRRMLPQPQNQIRLMTEEDLEIVFSIDHTTFTAPWVLSKETIINAYSDSDYAAVVIMNNKVVGYLLSSLNNINAHISRIAIHPDAQGNHFGKALMGNCIHYYISKDIWTITVNTQKDNLISQKMYQNLGFIDLKDNFPVFRYTL